MFTRIRAELVDIFAKSIKSWEKREVVVIEVDPGEEAEINRVKMGKRDLLVITVKGKEVC